MKYKIGIVFLLSLTLTFPAHAFSLRKVYNALINIYNVENQNLPNLSRLKTIEETNEKSLQKLEELKKNMSGNFGYGHLMNDNAALNARLWSNDNWTEVLAQTQGENQTILSQAQARYAKLYPSVEPTQIRTTNKNNLTRTHYEQTRDISRAALAGSQFSYDQINAHIKQLHQMLQKLEQHPEEKAAMDLNVRLIAELGFIQLEMLKQQSIQTQLLATQSQSEVNGLSDESKFLNF